MELIVVGRGPERAADKQPGLMFMHMKPRPPDTEAVQLPCASVCGVSLSFATD